MISHTTATFWKYYKRLPDEVRRIAKKQYLLFKNDPYHPGLHFKRVHSAKPIYSARITRNYRVVGILEGEVIVWFWIGSHDDYETLLKK